MPNTLLRRCLLVLLLAPALMLLHAAAQAQSPENETDSLYLGNRVMLVSEIPRQLTLNAHIQDFAWSPTGREIAFISHPGPSISDSTLCIARPEGGRPRIYYATHSDPETGGEDPASGAIRDLVGWSPDGNYLAFLSVSPITPDGHRSQDLDLVDLARGDVSSIPLPAWDDAPPEAMRAFWSPKSDLLALSAMGKTEDGPRLVLYDAAARQSHLLPTPSKHFDLCGWSDDGKIVVLPNPNGPLPLLQIDTQTGSAAPAPDAVSQAIESRPVFGESPARLRAGAAGMLSLSAGCAPDTVKDFAGKPHREFVTLWVGVVPDKAIPPFTKSWDPKTSQGVPPILRVDSYRTFAVWQEDMQTFALPREQVGEPAGYQAAFARVNRRTPDRAQIAYLISGDLYVSDITTRAPSVQELIAAGETLTCPEERAHAEQNARELSLALVQYSQDYDSILPPAENFHDAVYPYVRAEDAFGVGDHKFQFLLDGEAMKDLDHPESVEMGDFDLPCGRIVLYADGHVQALDKDGKPVPP